MSKTFYTEDGKSIQIQRIDKKTNFINYVGSSDQWIEEQNAKRSANELTSQTPVVQVFDKDGNYHEEGTNRLNLINRTSWYSEFNNTSFDQVIWNLEHRISPERHIGVMVRSHEEEFSGEQLPLITLARNVILEDREDNKSRFAYFITSRKKVANAYLFTVAVSTLGHIYMFDYASSQPTIAFTKEEVESIIKNRNRANRASKGNVEEILHIKLKQDKFVYHQIMYNLPNGKSDMDYVRPTQLTDLMDETLWAMLWEIQANQTKVVLLTAVVSASDIQKQQVARKKLREWKSQIQINIETANTTDQQSITVHNPQLQNTLPVYMKFFKDILNLTYQISGNAKDHESNDKGTAQQSIAEIKGLGGSQYETIQIKKKLRQMQLEGIFKRVIEFDKNELGNTELYPEDYTVRVSYSTTSESDMTELLALEEKKQKLGISSPARTLIAVDKHITSLDQAIGIIKKIKEENEILQPEDEEQDGEDGQENPNDPKNKSKEKPKEE